MSRKTNYDFYLHDPATVECPSCSARVFSLEYYVAKRWSVGSGFYSLPMYLVCCRVCGRYQGWVHKATGEKLDRIHPWYTIVQITVKQQELFDDQLNKKPENTE